MALFVLFSSQSQYLHAQYTIARESAVSLDGKWFFSLDPLAQGEGEKRYDLKFPVSRWDTVTVPHCFSADKRFEFYTGNCWYRRSFEAERNPDKRTILHFDGIYYTCKVWLNGKKVGEHEGGYTPFEFDITDQMVAKGSNILTILVNNSWSYSTIPGAKPFSRIGESPIEGLFAWINYGGIIRPTYLTEEPTTYISHLKLDAVPDLKLHTAELALTTFINNSSVKSETLTPKVQLTFKGKVIPIKGSSVRSVIAPLSNGKLLWKAKLSAADVNLWNPETPNLYTIRVIAGQDTMQTDFGIRKIEVSGAKLLLNGVPIKRGGANRILDYPELGSKEPDSLVERDFQLMKSAGMTFQRIYHHPSSEILLHLADKYGMLIIEENGNTGLKDVQLADTLIQNNFKRQFTEMVQRDWNHPSVIAWSVGNEFDSEKTEGINWVRDMKAFVKSLDSRMITFASNRVWGKGILKPTDEASVYSDFISTNIYDDHLTRIQHIHPLYPDKPILISEYGYRTDRVENENERIAKFKKVLDAIRSCEYVAGASVWSFNDYRSKYIGTNPNGFRPWGAVDPLRRPRPLYNFLQQEYCPVTVMQEEAINQADGVKHVKLVIEGRTTFPSYTIKNYKIRWGTTECTIDHVAPGQNISILLSAPLSTVNSVELLDATGFTILKYTLK